MTAGKEPVKKATRVRRPLEERLKEAQEKARKLRARAREKETKAIQYVCAAIFKIADYEISESVIDELIKSKGAGAEAIAREIIAKAKV
ncbi:MAG: hypothetical protein GX436_01470 [Synergistaceae bacterium]|nr:hypothetical protein [Synergistaceae bacterium]